jgi:hypothetical protein
LKDIILVALVVIAFAWVVTAHAAIVFGLVKKEPRWRAAVAFVVAPLAPVFAWREHMRVRTGLWIFGVVLYIAARFLASF